MDKIRVLFVDTSPEDGQSVRGLTLLLCEIAGSGIDARLFCSRPDLYLGKIPADIEIGTSGWEGFRDVRSKEAGLKGKGLLDALTKKGRIAKFGKKVLGDFEKIISEFHPDLVHLFGLSLPLAPFAEFCKEKNLPCIVHVHEHRSYQNREGAMLQKASKVLVCAKTLQHALNERFPEVYYKMYERFLLPVDSRERGPSPDPGAKVAFGIEEDVPVILALGPVRKHLGQEDILQAFEMISDELPSAQLWFEKTDDSGHTEELKRLALAKQLDNRITFFGNDTTLDDLCRASDLAVFAPRYAHPENGRLPYRYQHVGVAMAWGLPVVVTDSGPAADMVLGSGAGAVVPLGDVEKLASAIRAYLQKPQLWEQASAASRRRVENGLSAKSAAAKLAAIYRGVLA